MGILLWILIGLGAGLIVAALAPRNGAQTRSDSGRRTVRDAAAGTAGAVAAGYAFTFATAAAGSDGLTTAVASLAGGLWVAGIVEVYASRRRGGTSHVPVPIPSRSPDPIDMPAYDAAREALVAGLMEDAAAHDAGRYAEIGRQLPSIRNIVVLEDPARNPRLQLALRFWRGWTNARNDHWRAADASPVITPADWPRLARIIASDLALDRDVTDPLIVQQFASSPLASAQVASSRFA